MLASCCKPSSGAELDELRHIMLVWIVPSHEEAAATSPLCYSTTQPLYQGDGKPEEQSQEAWLAKCSTKSHLWSARLWVRASKENIASFPSLIHLKIDKYVSCACSCFLRFCESVIRMKF